MCLKRQGEAFGLEQISLGYRPLSFNSKHKTHTKEREREKKNRGRKDRKKVQETERESGEIGNIYL